MEIEGFRDVLDEFGVLYTWYPVRDALLEHFRRLGYNITTKRHELCVCECSDEVSFCSCPPETEVVLTLIEKIPIQEAIDRCWRHTRTIYLKKVAEIMKLREGTTFYIGEHGPLYEILLNPPQ